MHRLMDNALSEENGHTRLRHIQIDVNVHMYIPQDLCKIRVINFHVYMHSVGPACTFPIVCYYSSYICVMVHL